MKLNIRLFLFGLYWMAAWTASGQTTIFYDNCNSMANWTNTGRIYPANQAGYNWLSVAPVVPSDDHTGGGNCLYVNGNSNYVTAGAGRYILYRIESSAINLTGWDNTRLEFWMQMRSETGAWDGGYVEWSQNGTTWTQFTNAQLCVAYDGNMSNNASSTPFYPNLKPAWYNPRTTWTRVLVNLSAVDNVPAFYLRYTFHSDEEAMDRGWAIDDIKIVSIAMVQLRGNNIVIPGGNTPVAADNTDFGGCSVGQVVDKEFYIHNTGESPLTLTGTPYVTTTGTGFSVLTQPASNVIAPGQSVPFTVRFQPGAVGNFTGTVRIPHSDTYSACTVVNPFVYNIKASSLNTPPQITGLQTTAVCPGAGPVSVPFTVSDFEQSPDVITLTASSSNTAAIPNANITFSGAGANRNVIFTALPGQTGNVVITVTANDGQPVNNTSSATFTVRLEDTENPVAVCRDLTVQLDAQGSGTITPQQADAGSTDNCQLGPVSLSRTQFSCADVGTQTVSLIVADAVGNVDQCDFTVTVLPPAGSLTLQAPKFTGGKEISCSGASDGTIQATAQGGCAPYTYTWTEIPSFTGALATQLSAGTYHVSTTDAAGQVWTALITLEEPAPLTNLSTKMDVSCHGKADGRVKLEVSGGTAPYTYGNAQAVTGLPAGPYSDTATDANGCSLPISFIVLEPSEIVLTVPPSVSVQCGEEIPLSAHAFNGSGAFHFVWTGPGVICAHCALSSAVASESAVYEVTATDENGCNKTGQTLAQVDCNVYIPNAFTPHNGDMLNPLFRVYTGTVEAFSFSVFDRWGQLIYQSQNPDEGWKGDNGNKKAAQGVYVYKLTYRFPGGRETVLTGAVTLIGGD